ncbi:MAG: YabP/YqfC family sporulation protein [Patescibacteria group bacterium]
MPEERRRPGGGTEAEGANHQFTLVGRGHLTLDGTRNVVSFSPEEILLETTAGAMVIKGEDLHIQQLNLDEGRIVVNGLFASLAYAGEGLARKGKSLIGRFLR